MARPVTLYTGQWGDLSLEEVCKLASEMGYEGLEIATNGHINCHEVVTNQEYEKQVKISNEKNSAEIAAYNAELAQLKAQEQQLIDVSRKAQDIIKKPTS